MIFQKATTRRIPRRQRTRDYPWLCLRTISVRLGGFTESQCLPALPIISDPLGRRNRREPLGARQEPHASNDSLALPAPPPHLIPMPDPTERLNAALEKAQMPLRCVFVEGVAVVRSILLPVA